MKLTESREYKVLSKGNENSVVMITEPASERGQIMLMKGRDLWLFLPSVSQPVRLSLAQRLTGQVANGDIASANFSGDYNPKLAGTEKSGDQAYYVLELTGVDKGVTYQRVQLLGPQESYWSSQSGVLFALRSTVEDLPVHQLQADGGRMRPTRLVMTDALREGAQSVLDYTNMRFRDLPDKVFSKDYLKKLD